MVSNFSFRNIPRQLPGSRDIMFCGSRDIESQTIEHKRWVSEPVSKNIMQKQDKQLPLQQQQPKKEQKYEHKQQQKEQELQQQQQHKQQYFLQQQNPLQKHGQELESEQQAQRKQTQPELTRNVQDVTRVSKRFDRFLIFDKINNGWGTKLGQKKSNRPISMAAEPVNTRNEISRNENQWITRSCDTDVGVTSSAGTLANIRITGDSERESLDIYRRGGSRSIENIESVKVVEKSVVPFRNYTREAGGVFQSICSPEPSPATASSGYGSCGEAGNRRNSASSSGNRRVRNNSAKALPGDAVAVSKTSNSDMLMTTVKVTTLPDDKDESGRNSKSGQRQNDGAVCSNREDVMRYAQKPLPIYEILWKKFKRTKSKNKKCKRIGFDTKLDENSNHSHAEYATGFRRNGLDNRKSIVLGNPNDYCVENVHGDSGSSTTTRSGECQVDVGQDGVMTSRPLNQIPFAFDHDFQMQMSPYRKRAQQKLPELPRVLRQSGDTFTKLPNPAGTNTHQNIEGKFITSNMPSTITYDFPKLRDRGLPTPRPATFVISKFAVSSKSRPRGTSLFPCPTLSSYEGKKSDSPSLVLTASEPELYLSSVSCCKHLLVSRSKDELGAQTPMYENLQVLTASLNNMVLHEETFRSDVDHIPIVARPGRVPLYFPGTQFLSVTPTDFAVPSSHWDGLQDTLTLDYEQRSGRDQKNDILPHMASDLLSMTGADIMERCDTRGRRRLFISSLTAKDHSVQSVDESFEPLNVSCSFDEQLQRSKNKNVRYFKAFDNGWFLAERNGMRRNETLGPSEGTGHRRRSVDPVGMSSGQQQRQGERMDPSNRSLLETFGNSSEDHSDVAASQNRTFAAHDDVIVSMQDRRARSLSRDCNG